MKYQVIRQFKDKNTHERYVIGSEYETRSWQRAKKLQDMGYLGEKIVSKEPQKKQQLRVTSDKDDA